MIFGEIKAWFLTNAVVILGGALVLTAGYTTVLHFVIVPYHKNLAEAHRLSAERWQLTVESAQAANTEIASAVDRCNAKVDELKLAGDENATTIGAILRSLGALNKNTKDALKAYKPDPTKSACENAMLEVEQLRKDRGR